MTKTRKPLLTSCRATMAMLAFCAMVVASLPSGAGENDPSALKVGGSGLPVPRFVSLGAHEVNMRTGPGTQYPIKWLYRRKGYPVVVEAEFDIWRKVRDRDGETGWIHGSLLSGRRTVVIAGDKRHPVRALYESPHPASVPVVKAEDGVVGELEGCRNSWCETKIEGKKGWLPMDELWGVAPEDDKVD